MTPLLALPREIRDIIYREVLHGSTSLKPSSQPRKCLAPVLPTTAGYDTGDDRNHNEVASTSPPSEPDAPKESSSNQPEYVEGEASLRYSLAEPEPPSKSLLSTCRQLRAEMQDAIHRSPVKYRLRLAFRQNSCTIYPTWVSMPAFATRIDVLEVDMRVRYESTPSLFSTASSEDHYAEDRGDSDILLGGMVLLRRFLERGAFFISKKRAQKITIGRLLLAIELKGIARKDSSAQETFEEVVEGLNEFFLVDEPDGSLTAPCMRHRDEFLRFFAQRIDVIECRVGEHSKEWTMKEVQVALDRRTSKVPSQVKQE